MEYDELLMKYLELQAEYESMVIENTYLKERVEKLLLAGSESNTVRNESDSVIRFDAADEAGTRKLTQNSKSADKVDLFLSLFAGRQDICAKRWENKKGQSGYTPYCRNEWVRGVCQKPKIPCSKCKNSSLVGLDHVLLRKHLLGDMILGTYTINADDACRFLVMDFDKSTWQEDSCVVREVCKSKGVPVYAERSRSGNGCHLWFFFIESIKASVARKFGMAILSLAMLKSDSIKFDSYDRLFPSQDYMPKGGFGNLIALPLQMEARKKHNTVFVDREYHEISDQWALLSSIQKIESQFVTEFIGLQKNQLISGAETQTDLISNYNKVKVSKNDFPDPFIIKSNKGLRIDKQGISPKGIHFLRSLGSYANPEFFAKQAMRMSTYNTPRVTVVYEEDERYIVLPRGLEESILEQFASYGISSNIVEGKELGKRIQLEFRGQLREDQLKAFRALSEHDTGVLSASTGFGKTVLGARLIAEKKVSTLVLVHTKELAMQWIERLEEFLDIRYKLPTEPEKKRGRKKKIKVIGQLGGGKNNINGHIDVVLMQSMIDKDKSVKGIIDNYGMIIVDECHHVSSTSFSKILSETRAKYVYGLTATPIRKDGHHPIIFMYCGPIRYRVDAKKEALKRSFDHYVIPRFTSCRKPVCQDETDWHISDVYRHICENKTRNQLIVKDIDDAMMNNRKPLVLTERTSHIELLLGLMKNKEYETIELSGRLGVKDRKLALDRIRNLEDKDKVVIVATGKLIGEGFDLARLDTLFMAMPISWKGRIAQYVGRLNREYEGKEEVLVYDYIDVHIPVLEKMYHKRLTGYRLVGYTIRSNQSDYRIGEGIYDANNHAANFEKDIEDARLSIVISSPYIQKKKIDRIKGELLKKYGNGIRVAICIKNLEEYSDSARISMHRLASELRQQGIDVLQIENNQHKFAVIDNEIVWYGGVNLLGPNRQDDSVIRILSQELGDELAGVIENSESVKFGY